MSAELDQPDRTGLPRRVSIGLPVYNGEAFLRSTLMSLLAQDFTDFELLISDNGSTDATESICREFAACDPRVRYVREEVNRGACWNFNRVFELSRGEYFKFAAADDICAPTFVSRCVSVLDAMPNVVCCHTRTAKIGADGEVIPGEGDPTDGDPYLYVRDESRDRPYNLYDGTAACAHRRFRDVLLNTGWSVRCYGVIRADALRRTQMLRPQFGYEKVLMSELALQGSFHTLSETLFFQRVHSSAASNQATASGQRQVMAARSGSAWSFPRLQILRGYLEAIGRHGLSARERICCYAWIASYLFQIRKWRRVAYNSFWGYGTGASKPSQVQKRVGPATGRRSASASPGAR